MTTGTDRYYRLKAAGLCVNCAIQPSDHMVHCTSCRKIKQEQQKTWKSRTYTEIKKTQARFRQQQLKQDALEAYGGCICVCCGEARFEFLTLDHSNNDGAAHRRAMRHHNTYYWAKKNGYPQDVGLRVLCFNCNCSRNYSRYCPHETEKDEFYGWAPMGGLVA